MRRDCFTSESCFVTVGNDPSSRAKRAGLHDVVSNLEMIPYPFLLRTRPTLPKPCERMIMSRHQSQGWSSHMKDGRKAPFSEDSMARVKADCKPVRLSLLPGPLAA